MLKRARLRSEVKQLEDRVDVLEARLGDADQIMKAQGRVIHRMQMSIDELTTQDPPSPRIQWRSIFRKET